MNIQKEKKLINKLCAMLLIIALTVSNFLFVGEAAVSYAVETVKTNNSNVDFSAYFLNENGEKVDKIEKNIKEEQDLYVDVTVRNEGYFNGKITLANSNFNIKDEKQSQDIAEISENTVTLNQINAGSTVTIKLKIEAESSDTITADTLVSSSEIVLEGQYVDSKNAEKEKYIDIKGTSKVEIDWKSGDNTNAELSSKILTNNIYEINGEEKQVVQVLVSSKITENNYPVKQTQIDLAMAKKPENVSVYAKSTRATNSNMSFSDSNYSYNEENGQISVKLENTDTKNISWNKSTEDSFIISYIFNKDEDLSNTQISINDKILTYDDKELTAKNDVQIKDEIDGIISYSIENAEKEIYKGKIYTGEERSYNTTSKIDINYLDIATNITLRENETRYLTESEEKQANIVYKETKINKQEFINIFGEEGSITIKEPNGITRTINKDSETDDNGDIVITYSEGTTNVEFTTSKPISLGTLYIRNTKSILNSGYSRDDINALTGIKENISARYNDKEAENIDRNIELKNTSSTASLNVSTDTLSTIGTNENVKITATLLNNDESKDLYKNPTIKITLPRQVTKIDAKCRMLYGNGLSLGSATSYQENGAYVIEIKLEGEQTKYNTESLEGTTLVIYANIDLDSLAVSSDEKITLTYTNELATSFSDNAIQESNIKIMANTGVITTNNIEEYNVETVGNQGTKTVDLAVSSEEKSATVNISAINNEGSKINDVKILGSFPTGESNTLGARLTSGISIANSEDVQVYYSDVENPTADLEDTSNGWSTTGSADTSKSYLIIGNDLEVGEKLEASYGVSIPANLVYNLEAKEGYTVTYTNESTAAEKSEEATTLSLSTGVGPEVTTDLKAYVSGEEIKDQDEVNPGEVIKYQVTIENTGNATAEDINIEAILPENAKYVQYQKTLTEMPENTDQSVEENTGNEMLEDIEENTTNIADKDINDMTDEDMGFITEQDDPTETDENLGGESGTADYYKEIVVEDGKVSRKLDSLDPGEKITITYEIKVNEDAPEGSNITNTVNVTYDGITDTKTMTNKIGKAELSMNLYMIQRASNVLNAGQTYIYVLDVNNISGEKLSDISVEMKLNEQFTIKRAEVYGGEEETTIELNNNSFTIDSLEKAETASYMFYVTVSKTEGNTATISAIANNRYRSNQISENIQEEKISMTIESENAGQSVKSGDSITYNIKVTNEGDIAIQTLNIEQQLSAYLNIKDITVNGESVEYSQNIGAEDLENSYTITINQTLEKGETLNINVETTPDNEIMTAEDAQLVSLAKAYDEVLLAQTEEINHVLVASTGSSSTGQGENQGSETGGSNTGGTSGSETGGQGSTEGTRTISGTAWLDANENGQRDSDESALSGINVRLLDLQNNTIATATTADNGFYSLTKIPDGQYIAIFEYDTDKYILTSYKAEGIQESRNSDVENVTMNIGEEASNVAATDTLTLEGNDMTNVDIGLVEAKTFDLELTKTISKVTVSSKEGTQNLEYTDATLAKAEIKAKYLQGATVVVEYKIKVTNNGEVAGYVRNIVDYKPTDLSFNSSLNSDWYQSGDYLYTSSLANTRLEAGESKELTLVLTKTMTESNTGLVNNTAEIAEAYNSLNVQDTDSTPGNRQSKEDDMGSADLIISVKTGAMVSYVALTLFLIAVVAIGAYIMSKKILKKDNMKM